jgi:heat shock protein HtpX
METDYIIKGINSNEYPSLYQTILKLMSLYNIHNVRVIVRPKFENAATFTLIQNFLIIGKPLLENFDEREIEAILSHEFSHIFNRDTFSTLIISIIFMGPFFYLTSTSSPGTISSSIALLIILAFFFWIYGFKVRNWITLQYEIRADREAVIKTKDPIALQNALIKLTTQPFFSNSRPNLLHKIIESFAWIIGYFFGFEHPHLKERIEYLDFAKRLIADT